MALSGINSAEFQKLMEDMRENYLTKVLPSFQQALADHKFQLSRIPSVYSTGGTITGINSSSFMWVDEFAEKEAPKPEDRAVRVYSNSAFPSATVYIIKEQTDHDPLNANPASGPRTFYTIRTNGRQVGGQYPSVGIAAVFAAKMHERFIQALTDDARKDNPNFGKF